MEGATPEQEQALAQFAAVTTCESAGTAKFFLESSGWDLQGAVDAYFTTGGQVPGEAEAEGMDDANDDDEDAEETSRNPPQNTRGFTVAAPADEEQRWYTGGQSSGQEVIAPPRDRSNADDVMSAAQARGAQAGTSDDLAASTGAFQGGARTLAGGVVKAKDTRKMVIKFYANGVFTINDGPARDCDAPENQAFMQSIIRGECPTEINATEDTDVSLLKLGEDYTEPDKPKLTSFQGSGNKLGAGTSAAAAAPAPAVGAIEPWTPPDESLPITSLQLRLADGTRMVAKFNHSALVSHVRRFVASARPDYTTAFTMITGFPAAPIKQEDVSLAEAGLLNAVIILK